MNNCMHILSPLLLLYVLALSNIDFQHHKDQKDERGGQSMIVSA